MTVLRAVVLVGIDHAAPATVGAMSTLACVRERAHDDSDDTRAAAARDVIRAALVALGDGSYGRAARLLFGATDDTRGQPTRERRRLAAYQIDVMPQWFRRRYEPQIMSDVAAEVLNIEHATTEPDDAGDSGPGSSVVVSDDNPPAPVPAATTEAEERRSPVGRRVHRLVTRVRHPITGDDTEGSAVALASGPRPAASGQPRQLVGALRGIRDQQARTTWHLVWIAGAVVVAIRWGLDALPRYLLVLAVVGLGKAVLDTYREWRATRSLALGERWPRLILYTGAVVVAAGYVVGQDGDQTEPVLATDCELWQQPCDNNPATTTTDNGAQASAATTTGDDPATTSTTVDDDAHPSPYYVPTTYADPPTEATEPACPPAARGERRLAFTGVPPLCINPDNRYTATVRTNYGHFTVTLNTADALYTVNNFVFLARWGFYDGVQLIPAPEPTEPTLLPTDVWTHLASGHPISPGVAGPVGVPGYGLTFENHQGAYPDEQTFYLVMTDNGQPDRFAVIVTPEGHEQVTDEGGAYPLLGVVNDRCHEVIAQRDRTGGWDVTPRSEAIVIETITISEETANTPTTLPPTDDPCGRLAAAQDD